MVIILAFGDSITYGLGEDPLVGWVGRLRNFLETKNGNYKVYNLGVSTETSTDLIKRFDKQSKSIITKDKADKYVILVAIGANDCHRTPKEDFEHNITQLIKKAKPYTNNNVVILGITPRSFNNERVKLFNDIIKKCCKENQVLFLDMFETLIKEDYSQLLEDGLHPNSKGYDRMYQIVKDFLTRNEII